MEQPGDPLDRPEPIELDFMDCPQCGAMAEIGPMLLFAEEGKEVFTWRTLCLQEHFLDNYWFHTPACPDELEAFKAQQPDVTDS